MPHRLVRGLRGTVKNLVFQQQAKLLNHHFFKISTRNYSSRKSAFEDNLLRRIRNEIQYEIDRSPPLEPVAEYNSFKIDERAGEKWIQLSGKFGENEEIIIQVTMFDAAVKKETDEDIKLRVTMIVNVFKGKDIDVLQFVCSAWSNSIQIRNVFTHVHDQIKDGTYKGPKFKELDNELQDSLYNFLEERGIDDNLAEFLNKYMKIKEKTECLRWMEKLKCFIQNLLMVGSFEDAITVYKGLPRMDLSANSVTFFTLIDGYCKAGRIGEALEIFDKLRKASIPSAVCYKRIIVGLCEEDMADMAIDLFVEYIRKGLPLDRRVYMMLIESTLNRKGAEGVLEMMYTMEKIGLPALQVVCNDAISFLCEMGFPEASYSILIAMRSKGLALGSMGYHSILSALLFEGKRFLAQLILTSFIKTYGMSDLGVCKTIVNYLCLNNVKKALVFLSTMNEKKWSMTIPLTIFSTLTKDGRISDAYELFVGAENNRPDMNVIDYSIMINALCQARHIDKALDLCNVAKKKGISLNIVTFNSVINGLCHQGCLVEAFRLFDSLERIDVLPTEVTYGTLIDALVKEGLLQDARILFERIFLKDLRPTTHIYNSLINGYCKSSLLEEAAKLFQDLEARSLKADGFTVSALINGHCQKGDMEGALKLFFDLKSRDLLPDFLGFMFLLRGLCAKGRMEESRSILREMLQTPSVIDLLGSVDTEAESDSVENLLVFLCEQGRIHDAVALLEEVRSLLFSAKENSSRHTLDQHEWEANNVVPSIYGGAEFNSLASDVENVEDVLKTCTSENVEVPQMKDFDAFYSRIRSLCLKGELAKANELTRLLTKL